MRNFTLFSLFKIALKHIVVLILAAVVAGGSTYAYLTYVATPRYSAKGYVLITNGSILVSDANNETTPSDDTLTTTDFSISRSLLNVAVDILNTNDIYKELSKELDYKYSYSNLHSRATVVRKENSYLQIEVSFSASDPNEAVYLTNEFLSIVPDYIDSYIQNVESSYVESDRATKTYPQPTQTALIAAVAGAVVAYCVILIIYSANVVIQDEEDFKQRFDVLVLGCVPDFAQAKNNTYYSKHNKGSGYYGYKRY